MKHPNFQFQEDLYFFEKLLCQNSETIESYIHLFDFHPVTEKRKEFNRLRKHILVEFSNKYGSICQLNYSKNCDINSGLAIDHLIPLSTNELNKALRQIKPLEGRKVISQSIVQIT